MSALRELAEETVETHGIACRLQCDKTVACTDNFTATRLYRIAKEAVHNAIKHAGPEQIIISLASGSALTLQIQDNGRGISESARTSRGNGLKIMRHRCEVVGGKLDIRTAPDGGTIVTCTIPKEDS